MFSTRPSDSVRAVVLVIDICHSTAIVDDLGAGGNEGFWRKLLVKMDAIIRAHSSQAKYEYYKFLGDGWILLFDESEDTGRNVIDALRYADEMYGLAYVGGVRSAFRRHKQPPELTFGVTSGPLLKVELGGGTEYIGKAINEACRLQGMASNSEGGAGSRGYLGTGFYTEYYDNFAGLALEKEVALRNVEGGEKIKSYFLPGTSVRLLFEKQKSRA